MIPSSKKASIFFRSFSDLAVPHRFTADSGSEATIISHVLLADLLKSDSTLVVRQLRNNLRKCEEGRSSFHMQTYDCGGCWDSNQA